MGGPTSHAELALAADWATLLLDAVMVPDLETSAASRAPLSVTRDTTLARGVTLLVPRTFFALLAKNLVRSDSTYLDLASDPTQPIQ